MSPVLAESGHRLTATASRSFKRENPGDDRARFKRRAQIGGKVSR